VSDRISTAGCQRPATAMVPVCIPVLKLVYQLSTSIPYYAYRWSLIAAWSSKFSTSM
jgi:hypothetical protein